MPAATRTRPHPLRTLLDFAWTVPLISLPFAAFFLMQQGSPWRAFPVFWEVAMVFATPVALANWAVGSFLEPVIERRFPGDVRIRLWMAGVYLFASLVGALVAIVVLGNTLVPDFLRHGRSIIVALVYSALFSGLFMGASLGWRFYRQALAHAGSDRELQLARRIQRSFLLTDFPRRPRVEVHAVNLSSKEVSGDFYDVVTPNDRDLLLAIADVSGKGVPAALLSSMLQASLRTQAGSVASPAVMMRAINSLACQRQITGQFATFFLATLHEPTLTLRFTNAGHNFPVLLRADGTRTLLERGGLVVGMMEDTDYEEGTLTLAEGDRVVLYTDGVTEAARAGGEMFGEERLDALLDAASPGLTAAGLVEHVLAGVHAFLEGAEPGDDITVMVLRVLPGAAARPAC